VDASRIRQKIGLFKNARDKIEGLALRPVRMIDGYWVIRYIKCGKPGCKCTGGEEKHGPYYYISRTQKGKTRLEYVNQERFRKEKMCKKWSQYSGWIARIVKYNRQIEALYRNLARVQVRRSK
jgi:hypothetical protein